MHARNLRLPARRRRRGLAATALIAALALPFTLAGPAALAGTADAVAATEVSTDATAPLDLATVDTPEWVGAWGTAMAHSVGGSCAPCTIRSTAHLSTGGSAVRVTLSNVFSTIPLVVDRTTVSLPTAKGAASAVPGSVRAVTFGGEESVTVPAGQTVRSDAVEIGVEHGTDLHVTTYLPQAGSTIDKHDGANHTSYWANGVDAADAIGGATFTSQDGSGYVVSAVEVAEAEAAGTLVAFGDSITDGSGATYGADDRWIDRLAERMDDLPEASRLGIVNSGIGGNRLLVDQGGAGQAGPNRFARDVLAHDPTTVLILLGINDVRVAAQDAGGDDAAYTQRLIDALTDLADQAHADGVRVVGATLTPFKGWGEFGPQTEGIRQAVNDWIRTTDAFDAVVDFDAAVRDPADPSRARPDYDSGDGLHPGPAGYRAMAAAVDVADLFPVGRPGSVELDAPASFPATGGTTVTATVSATDAVGQAEVRLIAPAGWEVPDRVQDVGPLDAGEQVTVTWDVRRGPGGATRGELVADAILGERATSDSAQVALAPDAGAGLLGEYFVSAEPAWAFDDRRASVVDETVDFPNLVPRLTDLTGQGERVTVRWTGTITPELGDDYTFWVHADDGVRLWLDGELLVERWSVGAHEELPSRAVRLEAGESYDVRMELFQNLGGARAVLRWESPLVAKQVVPSVVLAPPGAEPDLDVPVTAEARCLAGSAYVAVRATNGEDVPVDVTLATPFGTKAFTAVAPGANAYQSFAVRGTSVEAGEADVTATATVDGEQVTTEVVAPYDATTCG